MLNILGNSKIRKNICLLFIYNQEKEFYVNEIARILHVSAGTTQRELKKLFANDFLQLKKKGNLVLYTLNKKNPILPELEAIIHKTIGISTLIQNALKNMPEIDFAFLFGSYVKGGFKGKSDIDLYIIGESDDQALSEALEGVEQIILHDINYHRATKKEFRDKQNKGGFIKEILNQHQLIIGDEQKFKQFIEGVY